MSIKYFRCLIRNIEWKIRVTDLRFPLQYCVAERKV